MPLSAPTARAADDTRCGRRPKERGRERDDQIKIRASVSDLDRFVEGCERNRYPYREGFGELVKLIDRA
jgi:hypothetical protein